VVDLAAPQLVLNSRALYIGWLPADPASVAAMLPAGLRPHPDRTVVLHQRVVDDETQTSGLGAHDLTHLAVALDGAATPGGAGAWWTHHVTSNERMLAQSRACGAPAYPGRTSVEVRGGVLVAETELDGVPVVRVRCHVGETGHAVRSGHHRYLSRCHGDLVSCVYAYVAEPVTPFEIESVEFLEPDHPVYALRPANPLTIVCGYYAPRASFASPGGLTVHPQETGRQGARVALATASRRAGRLVEPVRR
jgi:hypothetical protein